METWTESLGDTSFAIRDHLLNTALIHPYTFFLKDLVVLMGATAMMTLFA